jgi:hypothetical protein
MGTGKTYVGCEVLRRFDLPTLVVCPAIARTAWRRVGQYMGVEFDVASYEALVRTETPYGRWTCLKRGVRTYRQWAWGPEVQMVLFDEWHRAGGIGTLSSKLVIAAVTQNKYMLGATATIAESPTQFDAIGYALGLHRHHDFRMWCLRHGCFLMHNSVHFTTSAARGETIMRGIHERLATRCVRVRIDALPPGTFPGAVMELPEIEVHEHAEIDRLHAEARAAYTELHAKQFADGSEQLPLVRLLRARQRIELLKVPGFCELAQSALDAGQTVLVFLNFNASIDAFKESMPEAAVITGTTPQRERDRIVDAVQADQQRLVALNAECGGVNLSLHDVTGRFPRTSLVSMGFRAKVVRQVFGRTRRDGSRSTPRIFVPIAVGTVEERIKQICERKFLNLDTLNDGDLQG